MDPTVELETLILYLAILNVLCVAESWATYVPLMRPLLCRLTIFRNDDARKSVEAELNALGPVSTWKQLEFIVRQLKQPETEDSMRLRVA